MTPIQRVSVKSQALAVLGLESTAATDREIKSAYHAKVKEKHPDRCGGLAAEFMLISNAYEYLSGEASHFDPTLGTERVAAKAANKPERPVSRTERPSMDFAPSQRPRSQTMSRPISKPAVQVTKMELSKDVLSACKELLDGDGLLATHQERSGRKLSYYVPVRLLNIINKVAVPTGDLVDARRVKPTLLEINARDIKDGAYQVPQDVMAEQFPGARSVEIRFIADF